MLLETNHYTSELHEDWREKIKLNFPGINFSDSSDFLSIIQYIDDIPNKYYSKKAFQKYFDYLDNIKFNEPELLASILIESENVLNLASKTLTEINNEQIHDILLPNEYIDLINFIDNRIHYNLLKLYESSFFYQSYIITSYSWRKQKKGLDGLNLHNSVKELIKLGFDFIKPVYLHNVRNGIAHGKILYSDLDITYVDIKGNSEIQSPKDIVNAFDKALDISNGFCLALKVFYFTNPNYLEKYKIPIPHSILISELQFKANAPAWTITTCIESMASQNKRQLMVYIKNDNWDINKVRWFSFNTAYLTEKLTKCYDRLFFRFHSAHSKISPLGWAAFDAKKMRDLRENNETEIEKYADVLEDNLLYFIPKIKFPRFVYRFGSLFGIFSNLWPLHWKRYCDTFFPNPFIIRDALIHSKGTFACVQEASVIIKNEFQTDVEQLIRKNKKRIVNLTIKYSKMQCNHLSAIRYQPVKYIRIFIYDSDLRIRNLRFSGLITELIATIEVNTTKKIKSPDIYNGIAEQSGKYRIVWNNNWDKKKKV